ncbi:MAG: glycerophosphoryl diester phosphodiesterase membrane domain-containing protein [Candidatus ainarchaeum sp.]|nr:glycerophosphoryl diester phosphodiesterase membrane domain-containing protein [Candidatus ainarchaeum sp.]
MIDALVSGLKEIWKHPLSILPALIAGIAMAVVFYTVMGSFFELLIDIVFLGNVPDAGISQMPFMVFGLYSADILPMLLAGVVSLVITIATGFFYSNYAAELQEKNPSIGRAFGKTLEQGREIIALFVFGFMITAAAGIVFWALASVYPAIGAVSIALAAIIIILVLYFLVKISFVVPAMAIEGEKLKQGIGKSWEFTNKKFWHVVLFILLVFIITQAIIAAGSAVSGLVLEPAISAIIFAVFWALATAYSVLAIAFYYLEKE